MTEGPWTWLWRFDAADGLTAPPVENHPIRLQQQVARFFQIASCHFVRFIL